MTVVVVPTIALALDQERQLHQRFPNQGLPQELAYYGDRAATEKEAIKERLRDGTQRVLFTSPEALVTGLAQALRRLAARGELSHVVIDEAHLVRTWGLSFRPEFQVVASLIAELREVARAQGVAPPHVELLTATLSRQSLLLNDELFAGTGTSLFVGSTYLRTEIRYLFAPPAPNESRLDRVVEALHHLPRPAIVYTTKKESADTLAVRLRQAGFGRTAVFHGDVRAGDRLEILRAWSGDAGPTSVDVVVGTSAFGLGVDQSDVRSVIHACVPASVDRFYQEVGRGGRDGHAAVSVWMPSTTDAQEGRAIENATVLGDKKSWGRWDAMRSARISDDPLRRELVVDTSTVPSWLDYASDSNQLWNRNTLVLLQRAGVLDIVDTPPPTLERVEGEPEADWQQRVDAAWSAYVKHATVRIRSGIPNVDEATVLHAIDKVRREIRDSESDSRDRIERMFRLDECWGSILSEEYAYEDVGAMHAHQVVAPACSGCPAAAHVHEPSYAGCATGRAGGIPPPAAPRGKSHACGDGHQWSDTGRDLSRGRSPDPPCRTRHEGSDTRRPRNLGFRKSGGLPAVVDAGRSAPEGLVAIDPIVAGPPRAVPDPHVGPLGPDRSTPVELARRSSLDPFGSSCFRKTRRTPQYPDQPVKSIRFPHWTLSYFLRSL